MSSIYILKLQHGKYYVGKTADVARRIQEHKDGTGSAWTRTHKFVSVIKTTPETSAFDEEKFTKEYMMTYGIDNVRGGPYVREVLDDAQRTSLEQSIWSMKGCCMKCGRSSHFVANCFARTTVDGYEIGGEEEESDEEDDEEDEEDDEDEDDY